MNDRDNNTAQLINGLQPEAEISNASGNNVVHGLSSSVMRIWLQCFHCGNVHAHHHYFHAVYAHQTLLLRCSTCRSFNPQWGCWVEWMNVQLAEIRNRINGGNGFPRQLTEEIIWKYLFMRDRRKSESGEEEERGREICVVCQNEFGEEQVSKHLDCGHDYHYDCISKWLLLKNSCPLCACTVIPSNFDIFA